MELHNMKTLITGKVRDVYEVSDNSLVIVTTDRISAFDVILPTQIHNKGVVLNQLSLFWFNYTKEIIANHILSNNLDDMPPFFQYPKYQDRTVLVKKLHMIPYEFVVRGYMFGSMWGAYKSGKSFCGYTYDREYKQAEKLEHPILTPSVKHDTGHDEYITMAQLNDDMGREFTQKMSDLCFDLYNRCYEYALDKGIIIADTKFEFGYDENNNIVLADEIFTPDSSRFWDAGSYTTGISPQSYDKQFIRDWLTENRLNGVVPAPEIPGDIARRTETIYADCYQKIVG